MAERKLILLLSGEIASGKTTLSKNLQDKYGFKVSRTREGIKKRYHASRSREDLQIFGEKLDKTTKGRWVLEHFQDEFYTSFFENDFFVIDSVRIKEQIEQFRRAYGYSVFHIHLLSSDATLYDRFIKRGENKDLGERKLKRKYSEFKKNNTESQVNELADKADLVIDTDRCNANDVFVKVVCFLKLLPPNDSELVDIIVGGQFGSEGKGQVAAYLSPNYDCLLRVGGPNAGHSVYEEPIHDVFHLLPSGTNRNKTAKLILGPGSVINLKKILEEVKKFGIEDRKRLIIDENVTVISEEDIKNEKKYKKNIGSTTQGVGYATAKNIIERIKGKNSHKAKHFKELSSFIGSSFEELQFLFRHNKKILLEGTQGTLLSLHHGIYPYVTSRDTSASGCLSEAGISPKRVRKIILVTRTYPIRVAGNSGPFLSNEIGWNDVSKRSRIKINELLNREKTTTTKRDRRVAEFSWPLFQKSCELNSPTDIALTFSDYICIENRKAKRYEQLTSETKRMIEEVERCAGVPVSLISTSFDYRAIIDRRNWI
ncbi:MAG: adenylosuccinate synthetase [Ignavibacteriae bacterium]|nr:adenylosuccinate synthetase [Ignavibacteriota bacterium]MCB9242168.1 adenylosuccinate synthetase [Ignavibacteriales bacterium]